MALEPVVLNGWPSCQNGLSWSSDGEIAVAVGEHIHILTPKQASQIDPRPDGDTIGLRQWFTARIRTDKFTQHEWPDQVPGPSSRFSLGEEQSLSTVIGLAWSPPGIGPHRRSVLAVLTSNLVLSLWESNGTIGDWRRVLMVNQSLADYFGSAEEVEQDIDRERRRIRAFTWGLPYKSLKSDDGDLLTSRWGVIHLAVANDDNAIVILEVARRGHPRALSSKAICHVNLAASDNHQIAPHTPSLFQKAMYSKSTVSEIIWANSDIETAKTYITVDQGRRNRLLELKASAVPAELSSNRSLKACVQLAVDACNDPGALSGSSEVPKTRNSSNAKLKKQIEDLRLAFDAHHGLDGNSMVRIWGSDSSETSDLVCTTVHPTDMVEYTTASMEKSTLSFAPNDKVTLRSSTCEDTTIDDKLVQNKGVSYILQASKDINLASTVDRSLLRIAAICGLQSEDETLRREAAVTLNELFTTSDSDPAKSGIDIEISNSGIPSPSADVETCQICKAAIPFDESSRAVARCKTGHLYTRCNLSLLAVQEPGTSKYCSRCDRQYLNAELLDLAPTHEPHGPSLMTLLFEEHDLCPFCAAKFRG